MKYFAPMLAVFALTATMASAQSATLAPTPSASPPQSATPPAAPATAISVETTPIDELLENPQAMEILYKHFPEMKGQEDQLAMAGSMTLRDIQAFAADAFTDEKLAAVEVDFQALSAS